MTILSVARGAPYCQAATPRTTQYRKQEGGCSFPAAPCSLAVTRGKTRGAQEHLPDVLISSEHRAALPSPGCLKTHLRLLSRILPSACP